MIISMSDIICVTNRSLCKSDFLIRIEAIAQGSPAGIILREKDLSEKDYEELAKQVMIICKKYQIPCILHNFVKIARKLQADAIHLPLPILRSMSRVQKDSFHMLGASCHSLEEAKEAEELGCTYLTAGHIFATDCKKGAAPRGLDFLERICDNVSVPVYAIGGINRENFALVQRAGAKGACMMSGLMCCEDVGNYLEGFEHNVE